VRLIEADCNILIFAACHKREKLSDVLDVEYEMMNGNF
jgi:hypothetical protein